LIKIRLSLFTRAISYLGQEVTQYLAQYLAQKDVSICGKEELHFTYT